MATTAQPKCAWPPCLASTWCWQRDRPLNFWGQATPGQTLNVEFAGARPAPASAPTAAGRVQLAPLPAGGPHRLVVKGDQTVELKDVLIGDVWLLGGQSNMEWPLAQTDTGPVEVASPQNAQLRHLRVPLRASVRPEAENRAAPWMVPRPPRGRIQRHRLPLCQADANRAGCAHRPDQHRLGRLHAET